MLLQGTNRREGNIIPAGNAGKNRSEYRVCAVPARNADLPIGIGKRAYQEIGGPAGPPNALSDKKLGIMAKSGVFVNFSA